MKMKDLGSWSPNLATEKNRKDGARSLCFLSEVLLYLIQIWGLLAQVRGEGALVSVPRGFDHQ
jgi:hypothetical protein